MNTLMNVCKKIYKALEAGAAPVYLRVALNECENEISIPKKLWVEFTEVFESYCDSNIEQKFDTLISCRKENCCGCLTIVYAPKRQQLETVCNECGQISVIMNHEGLLVC